MNDSDLKIGEAWRGFVNDHSFFVHVNEINPENQEETKNIQDTFKFPLNYSIFKAATSLQRQTLLIEISFLLSQTTIILTAFLQMNKTNILRKTDPH